MPTGVFDSSLLTQRKRDAAVYYAAKARQDAVNATTGETFVRGVQGGVVLQETYTQTKQVSGNTNPDAECPCSAPVVSNPGGGTISSYVQ